MNFKPTKVFAFLLSVLMLVGIVPFSAFAAGESLRPAEVLFEGTTIRVNLDADNIAAVSGRRDLTAEDIKAVIPDNFIDKFADEIKAVFLRIIKDTSDISEWLEDMTDNTETKNLTVKVINNVLGHFDDITINGVSVFNASTGKFSASRIFNVVADAVKNAGDGFSLEFIADLDDSETPDDAAVKVVFKYVGEESSVDLVRELLKKPFEYAAVDGKGARAEVTVPAKVSGLITKVLASDKLSDGVKTDILSILSTDINDAAAIVEKYAEKVAAMTDDELLDLADLAADMTDPGKKLSGDAGNEAAKRADAEQIREITEKALNTINAVLEAVPDQITDSDINEKFYGGNGVFSGTCSVETVFDASVNSLFSYAETYFEEFKEGFDVGAAVEFENLYQVKFKVGENIVFITYVPEGTEFADIEKYIPVVAGVKWVFEGGREDAVVVPAEDSVVVPANNQPYTAEPSVLIQYANPPKTGDPDSLSAVKTAVLGYSAVAVLATAAVTLFKTKKKKDNW